MLLPLLVALGAVSSPASAGGTSSPADCTHLPPPPVTGATPNDNRTRAGVLRDGVLTVRLVARRVAWRPDGPSGCALSVNGFAEEGKTPTVPGPLVRVTTGTRVHATVRNALPTPLWVRGLHDRSAGLSIDSVEVMPGGTREFDFVASAPGGWFYWAGLPARTARRRTPTASSWVRWSWTVRPRKPQRQRRTTAFSC